MEFIVLQAAAKSVIVIVGLLTAFAYMTWLERKLVARFQLRVGPNRVGIFGLLQPVADGIKLLFKEDFRPGEAEPLTYLLAPAISVASALLAFAVIPLGPAFDLFGYRIETQIADVNVGVLFVLAVSALGVYGIVLGGWSSNNKYTLIGCLRSAAQVLSYELAMALAILSPILLTGNLHLSHIVQYQATHLWLLVLQPVSLALYLLAALAETNRAPFDLPEAEHELIGGYQTEYGGMKFALFYMAEYINIITVCAVATTLFLGGWLGPGAEQFPLLGYVYFAAKMFLLVFGFIWLRATLPRVRYDHLMGLGWKIMIPVGLLNVLATAALTLL